MRYIVVLVTVPKKREARFIASRLLDKKLAACVNISSEIDSFFHWEGKIDNSQEYLLTIKTKKVLFPRLVKEIKSCHSYTVPEIIALPIVAGDKNYLDWIDGSLG